ncbi:MAG: type IV toxin-antitoxin system AbiEi family antitoxin domain-containing protein [Bacilli bacterium]|nr:type IV toxin-antitoxin system AbiEi family antitoxin domain-containing protein [Bacilli bacterium]
MSKVEKVLDMARANNGVVTSAMVTEARLSRALLGYMTNRGYLDKSCRGVYTLPGILSDGFYDAQTVYGKGVFSHGSALYLLGLTDRTPNQFTMTFPSTYNLSNPKASKIICKAAIDHIYKSGIIYVSTDGGHEVRCYNMEKTLCDILRGRGHEDIQLISEAFKRYAKRADKNLPLLSEYSKQLKVEHRVRNYLEVLL